MRRRQLIWLGSAAVVVLAAALVVVLLRRGGPSAIAPEQTPRTAPVLVVKIDNVNEARPATGLGSADVIYVEPVEGGLTRVAAVFTANRPDVVGPVRSARETDFDLLAQYGHPVFAYSGAAPEVLRALHTPPQSDRIVNASLDDVPAAYFRQADRAAPHNLYAHPSALPTSEATAPEVVLPRGAAPSGGTPAVDETASFGAASFAFHWDGGRWQIAMDGRPFTSTEAGQLAAASVIVARITVTTSALSGGSSPLAHTVGTGAVTVLRDGQAFRGTWSRPSPDAGMTFTTDTGAALPAAPGPVWVLLVPA